MSTKKILLLGSTLLVIAAIAGLALFNLIFSNTTAPSAPLTAVPLVINTAVSAADSGNATDVANLVIFQIVPDESEVSFSIYEELAGQPNTVVGTTNQVIGQLAVDTQDLSRTQVGTIQVNARTLTTDNDRRNGTIRNFILNTD